MRIGVVVTRYNLAEWLPACLDSVLAQTREPDALVVVDDGSADETQHVVSGYGSVDYVRLTNRGPAQAKNAGAMWLIERSHVQALVFADADDRMFPEFLNKTEARMESGSAIGLVSTGLVADGVTVQGGYWPATETPTIEVERERNVIWQMGLVRARPFVDCGGFNHRAGPVFDWDLWLDFMKRGWQIRGVNEPLWYWRDRADGMHTSIDIAAAQADLRQRHPEVY